LTGGILAIIAHAGGKPKKTAFELLTVAHALARQSGGAVRALLLGSGAAQAAEYLGAWGVEKTYAAEAGLECYAPLSWVGLIAETARTENSAVILLSADSVARDIAARVAARLGGVLASDCIGLSALPPSPSPPREGEGGGADWQEGSHERDARGTTGVPPLSCCPLTVTRPVFSGRLLVTAEFRGPAPLVATLRPNTFALEAPAKPRAGVVVPLAVRQAQNDLRLVVTELVKAGSGRLELAEAALIVAGGRGVGSVKNFQLILELAEALGASPGASRAAVDAGYAPHSLQIGQSGKTVNPALYLACGISGSMQHLAGMRTSRCIVAINKDSQAPIFKFADYGVVGDLFEVIPALIAEVKHKA